MSLTTHDLTLYTLDTLMGVESLCLFVAQDERPLRGITGLVDWRLNGSMSRLIREGFFAGNWGEKLLLPTNGRLPIPRIFVLGIGSLGGLTEERLHEAMTDAGTMLTRAHVASVALEVPGDARFDEQVRAQAILKPFGAAFRGAHVALFGERALAKLLPTAERARRA